MERDKGSHNRQLKATWKQLEGESVKRAQLEHALSNQKAELSKFKDRNVKLDRELNKALMRDYQCCFPDIWAALLVDLRQAPSDSASHRCARPKCELAETRGEGPGSGSEQASATKSSAPATQSKTKNTSSTCAPTKPRSKPSSPSSNGTNSPRTIISGMRVLM
jgi:hypothetical protein